MMQIYRDFRVWRETKRLPPRAFGIVVMDMPLQPERCLKPLHGSLPEGVQRVCDLILEARKLGIPILLVQYGENASYPVHITPSVVEAAGPDFRLITKRHPDGFRCPDRGLETASKELGIRTFIVAGHSTSGCVRGTIEGALDRGYSVVTSMELLFTHTGLLNSGIESTLAFFRRATRYYERSGDIHTLLHAYAQVRAREKVE